MFLLKKTEHFIGNLAINTIEHISEMKLYIILSTLEKFEHWNWSFNHEILVGEMVLGARSSLIVHIGMFFRTTLFFFLIILLNSDVMPHPTESSTLTVNIRNPPSKYLEKNHCCIQQSKY